MKGGHPTITFPFYRHDLKLEYSMFLYESSMLHYFFSIGYL